jgi:hypothetical protein
MFKSKLVTVQKLLEDVHEESLPIPKPNQPVPMQPFRRAFEGVRTPHSVTTLFFKKKKHTNGSSQWNDYMSLSQHMAHAP